jgi:hypothetical protein
MKKDALTGRSIAKRNYLGLGLLLLIAHPALCQVIPTARLTTWQANVGVPGGITNRTTIYQTFSPGATAAQINAALAACPSNQVVYLNAGTYNIAGRVNMTKNGVTLRGAGPGQTTLAGVNGNTVFIHNDELSDQWSTPARANHVSLLSGFSQGSTNFTLAATNLAGGTPLVPVGRLIYLDQLNDADTSAVATGGGAPATGLYTSIAYPNVGQDRWQQQVFKVISVNGNTVIVNPPVCMVNWATNLLPQIWWQTINPIEQSGVEDLSIAGTYDGSFSGIVQLGNCYGCWVKNVNITGGRRVIYLDYTSRTEVRHCRLDGPCAADPYGIAVYHSSGVLVEDNIVNGVPSGGTGAAILITGCSGSVFGYNYTTNFGSSGWQDTGISFHGNHPTMNLFEGNYCDVWSADNQWGSSGYNTSFRNRWTGHDESDTAGYINNTEAVDIAATNRHFNVVGNVLGTTGVNTLYEDAATCSPGGEIMRVYLIGSVNSYCQSGAYDPVAYSTLLRAVNWDSANQGIVGGGYTVSDLPNSYYLASKPSWFGKLPWPPIDPANPSYSGSHTNIPAGYRFIFGIDPPSALRPSAPQGLRVAGP